VVDVALLRKQASTIGTLQEDARESSDPGRQREYRHLEGVWDMLHVVLDDLESGKTCMLMADGRRRRK
jgi:hypothetical protein